MIYWKKTIPWTEHYDYSEGERLIILNENSFFAFKERFVCQTGLNERFLLLVTSLKVSGSKIDTFDFLQTMPNLKKIYFLANESDCWTTLHGTAKVEALSLHNLKYGKRYLDDTAFLLTFPNIRHLYINMLGVSSLPEVSKLALLCSVFVTPRNENAIKELFDFDAFEQAPSLEIFCGCMAVDRHRVPAEAFIPVLKNPSLWSFQYTQMYITEDKKLLNFIGQYHPALLESSLSDKAWLEYMRADFAL